MVLLLGLKFCERKEGKYNDCEGKWIVDQGFIWKHEKENGMKILLAGEVEMQWRFYLLKKEECNGEIGIWKLSSVVSDLTLYAHALMFHLWCCFDHVFVK